MNQQLNNQVATTLLSQVDTLRGDVQALLRTPLSKDMSMVAIEELCLLTKQLQSTSTRLLHDFKRTGFLTDEQGQT